MLLPLGALIRFAAPVRALTTRAQAWGQTWSQESQQVARRNAMVATNTLMARRRDREHVESWFEHEPAAARRAEVRSARRVAR